MYDLVLLLGGTGSRMKNKPKGNKHLVKINDKTNVEHIKEKIDLYESAVEPFQNKYVITNATGVDEIMKTLGQGYTYLYQQKPTGIPDAMKIANPSNPFLLHLGDQFYTDNIAKFIQGFAESKEYMRVWLKETKDTNHTVALFSDNMLKRFVEKPNYQCGITGKVATGMYMVHPKILTFVDELPRHDKQENNMSDLGNKLLGYNLNIGYKAMKGNWSDINSQEFKKIAEQYR